jgi:hypothetical protein
MLLGAKADIKGLLKDTTLMGATPLCGIQGRSAPGLFI